MKQEFDETSCGVVAFRKENGIREYLLLRYPSGHWDFPKGHIEKGENKRETALRELEEETGIRDFKFVENFEHAISYTYDKNGKYSHKQVVFFLGETKEKNIKLSFEHKGFIWLPYDEAVRKVTFVNARKILGAAEKFLQRAAITGRENIHRK